MVQNCVELNITPSGIRQIWKGNPQQRKLCSKALQCSRAMRDAGTSSESDFIPVFHMLNETLMQKHERKRGAEELTYSGSLEKLSGCSRRKLFFQKPSVQPEKYMILHVFSSNCQLHKVYKSCPGANLPYPSDFENAPHFIMMNVHKLLFYAKSYFLHYCFAPSCTFNKARCSI